MKNKILNYVLNIKYEIVIFLMLCIRAVLNLDFQNGMDKSFTLYYLVDFSMSKTSRVLIGSLVSLLTDKPTETWINCFAGVILFLTFVFTTVIVGQIIKRSDEDIRPAVFVFSLFFASGSYTLYGFSKFFGMLDIYMYLFTVLSLLVIRKKCFKWLVPVFCIGGVLVNYGFTISYFPIIAVVLLYLIATEEKKAENVLLLLLTVLISIALTVYFVFYGEKTTTVTIDELWNIVEQKSGINYEYDNIKYYDYYLNGYDQSVVDLGLSLDKSTLSSFLKMYAGFMIPYGFDQTKLVGLAINILPIIAAFVIIWVKCIKASKKKSKKFVYLCFILSMLFTILCCMTSTDTLRWVGTGVMLQFGLCYFMIAVKDDEFKTVMVKMKGLFKSREIILGLIYIIYAFGFNYYNLAG